MPAEITARQQDALSAIAAFIRDRGYSPTVRELGECLGLHSSCSAQRHVEALERKGYITRCPGQARSILPVALGKTCPVCRRAMEAKRDGNTTDPRDSAR